MQGDARLGTPYFRKYISTLPPEKQVRIIEQAKRSDNFRRSCESRGRELMAAERKAYDYAKAETAKPPEQPDPEIVNRQRADALISAAMSRADQRVRDAEAASHNMRREKRYRQVVYQYPTAHYDQRTGRVFRSVQTMTRFEEITDGQKD